MPNNQAPDFSEALSGCIVAGADGRVARQVPGEREVQARAGDLPAEGRVAAHRQLRAPAQAAQFLEAAALDRWGAFFAIATGMPLSETFAFRLYDLRHTCATLRLAANVNPKIVSERLGHSTIVLTLDTYSQESHHEPI